MTTPPPINWRPIPPSGPTPPNQGGAYGQQPPPGAQRPAPPPKKSNTVKWLAGAVVFLLVVAASVGATWYFLRDSGGSGGGETTTVASTPPPVTSSPPTTDIKINSAKDQGPTSIITEEPTCRDFPKISNGLTDLENQGWADLRTTLLGKMKVSDWNAEQSKLMNAVASKMRDAAGATVALARQTDHRVVRELYEQFTAYGQAYADKITRYTPADSYTAADDALASVNVNISNALAGICNAITEGAAVAVEIPTTASPPIPASSDDPSKPQQFLSAPDPTCGKWQQLSGGFDADLAAWQKADVGTSASEWTPESRNSHADALPELSKWAEGMDSLAKGSGNAVLADIASTASQYVSAYVTANANYAGTDGWLMFVAFRLNQTVLGACSAVGS